MALATDYRPTKIKEFYGNAALKQSLLSKLKQDSKPHVYLFTGMKGCGKTTLARIVANSLKCHEAEFNEVDASDDSGGVAAVRALKRTINYSPMSGDVRVWFIDECFAKGTKVKLVMDGYINIEDIRKGDLLYSLQGVDIVKNTFKNKVQLNRVCKVITRTGKEIYCSTEHKYLTTKGWKFAKDLSKEDLLLPLCCDIMQYDNYYIGGKNEKRTNVSMVQDKIQTEERNTNNLFKIMCFLFKNSINWARIDRRTNMQTMRENNDSKEIISKDILQSKLFSVQQNKPTRNPRSIMEQECFQENINKTETVFTNKEGIDCQARTFKENDREQSNVIEKEHTNNAKNKENKRNAEYICGGTGREREIHGSANNIIRSIKKLAVRISDKFRKTTTELSNKLQSRLSEIEIETSNRNRWQESQLEKEYCERYKESEDAEYIRVESVEIYKQRHNDESFKSIITNTERSQGFVYFYDIEMTGHPSYFVEGVAVHNCHKISKAGQEAFLKMLEEPPEHAYFILATTDPQKLLPTFKDRCITFEVKPLSAEEMEELLNGIVEAEEKEVPQEVIEHIVDASQGQPRAALQILERVIDLPEAQMLKSAQQTEELEKQAIDLCRVLMESKPSWKKVSAILRDMQGEPESIRYAVLGYCNAILLKGDNPRAYAVMSCFTEPYYNTMKSGLTMSAYEATTGV